MTNSFESSTSPSSLTERSSLVSGDTSTKSPSGAFGSELIISMTSDGALKMFAIFWNKKFDIKPRRTTSRERIFLGIDSTCSASSLIISPFSSSPITGKKLSSSWTFCFLWSLSPLPPDVLLDRSFANSSKIISVLAGSKSNT